MSRRVELFISMRDRFALATDIYFPTTPAPHPTILIRTPYGRREPYCDMIKQGEFWSSLGYVCVVQDCRGKWDSQGIWEPFLHEREDGHDTLDWIVKQPWSNGDIGMTGESYYGLTQWAAASTHHPALKCIAPGHTASSAVDHWLWREGILQLSTFVTWGLQVEGRFFNSFEAPAWGEIPIEQLDELLLSRSCHYFKEWLTQERQSSYWKARSFEHYLETLTLQVFIWGGWRDIFIRGTMSDHRTLSETGKGKVYLSISPDDHEHTWLNSEEQSIKIDWPYEAVAQFFDIHLKGSSTSSIPSVRYFVLGSNRWEKASEWPLRDSYKKRLYLNGESLTEAPQSTSCSFPLSDASSYLKNLWRLKESATISLGELTSYGYLFVSSPLSSPIEIRGAVSLVLETDVDRLPLSLSLWRVTESKECLLILENSGIFEVVVGQTDISLGDIAFTLREGERLALQISKPAFPHFVVRDDPDQQVGLITYSQSYLSFDCISSEKAQTTEDITAAE